MLYKYISNQFVKINDNIGFNPPVYLQLVRVRNTNEEIYIFHSLYKLDVNRTAVEQGSFMTF